MPRVSDQVRKKVTGVHSCQNECCFALVKKDGFYGAGSGGSL